MSHTHQKLIQPPKDTLKSVPSLPLPFLHLPNKRTIYKKWSKINILLIAMDIYFIKIKPQKKKRIKTQIFLMQCYILHVLSNNRKYPLERVSDKQRWIFSTKSWFLELNSGMRNLLFWHKSDLIKTTRIMDINFYN